MGVRLVYFLLYILFTFASFCSAESIIVVTEDFPPYNYLSNGQAEGISSEIVTAALKESGITTKSWDFYPWPRSYAIALAKKNVLIYSIARVPERETLFQWVGTIAPYKTSFYMSSNQSFVVNSMTDAKKFTVGVSRDDAIKIYLEEHGFDKLHVSRLDVLNIRMLLSGKFQLIAYDEASFQYRLEQTGLDPNAFERIYRIAELTDELYMAFSKQTNKATVEKLRNGLSAIKEKGIYSDIQRKYGLKN